MSDLVDLKRTRGGRQRVLAAAADVFRTHTLGGTSLQMIADRLGVTKAAVYYHFRTREEIVAELVTPVLQDGRERVASVRRLPPDRRRSRARDLYLDYVVHHRHVVGVVFFEMGALDEALAATVRTLVSDFADALTAGDGPESVAHGQVLVYGIAALVANSPDVDDAALRARIGGVLAGP